MLSGVMALLVLVQIAGGSVVRTPEPEERSIVMPGGRVRTLMCPADTPFIQIYTAVYRSNSKTSKGQTCEASYWNLLQQGCSNSKIKGRCEISTKAQDLQKPACADRRSRMNLYLTYKCSEHSILLAVSSTDPMCSFLRFSRYCL
ncbi:hypothetical protein BV898_03207 [Hypsibius exemplaris]|uniref:SUEL-type lectin domain-containing protein n=1 Tax=Hypsibius exemplaris TaxID=2072580 RepID=A0A1W0X602_HYPEX|nr:hypothetical protein BV898_03207 [Hypsibius exemplaris]